MDKEDPNSPQKDPDSGGINLEQLLEERARLEELIHKKFTQTITVMFTDFKGSTALAESEGDVSSRLLIKKHHDMLFPIIKENEGVLVKTMGDGTLSWFGKAQNAVRAAVRFQKSLKEFNQGRPPGKTPLLVRIGLNTGMGIVEDNDIFGDAVNVASRFEALASPREIYISETTFDSLDAKEEFRCRLIKTTELKGKAGLHKVFKVYWDETEKEEDLQAGVAADKAGVRTPQGFSSNQRPGLPQGMAPRLGMPFMSRPSVPKRQLDTGKSLDERAALDRSTNEIKSLIVRRGDTFRMSGEGYKVHDDIIVEQGALLVIEDAQVFFAENAGIVSTGTFRAKNTLFSAMDPVTNGWRNIFLDPRDGRVNIIEGCTFSFGKGRAWGSLPVSSEARNFHLNDNFLYGGGLLVRRAPQKTISVNGCVFRRCSAHEGGGIFLVSSQVDISKATFDNCTARISGGGIFCLDASSNIRGCTFNGCSADKGGGGMACHLSSPVVENCTFEKCISKFLYGGGLHCADSAPMVSGCKFLRCSASKDGGGIYQDTGSSPRILHATFTDCVPNGTNTPSSASSSGKKGWSL